jgi:hypothetical protein
LSAVSGALGLSVHQVTRRASMRLVGGLDRVRRSQSGPTCLAA